MSQLVTDENGIAHYFPDDASPDEMNSALNGMNPTWKDKAGHYAELGDRFVVEGATALPEFIGNIPAMTANTTRWAADKALGIAPSSPNIPLNNTFSQGLTGIGLDQPETSGERIAGDIIRPLVGTGTTLSLGKEALTKGSEFIGPKLAALMASNPEVQYEAAAGSGAAGGEARELGYGPKMQLLASMMGGIAAPSAVAGAKAGWAALPDLLESSQKQRAANFLAQSATDPRQASSNLSSAQNYVPDFQPTGGTMSGDTNLIAIEKAMRQQPLSPLQNQFVQNNNAVNKYFSGASGTPADIAAMESAREQATSPLYQRAAGASVNYDSITPAIERIDTEIAKVGPMSDAGKTLAALKAKIQSAVPTSEESILTPNDLSVRMGMTTPQEATREAPLSHLQQIYREERDALNKTGMQPGAYGQTVKNAVTPANMSLGAALEQANPDFASAQSQFRDMSVPIDQKRIMQEIGNRMTGGVEDTAGNNFFSPSKLGNLMKEGQINTDYKGWQPLSDALSPEQNNVLENINKELQRSNLTNTVGTTPGSGTFNNTTMGDFINKASSKALSKVWVLGDAYKYANDKTKEQILAAMMQPGVMQNMLVSGKISNSTLAEQIKKSLESAMFATNQAANMVQSTPSQ